MCLGAPEPQRLRVNLAEPPPSSVFAERLIKPMGSALGEAMDLSIDPTTGQAIIQQQSGTFGRSKTAVSDEVYQALRETKGKKDAVENELKTLRLSLSYLEGDELKAARESLVQKESELSSLTNKINTTTTAVFVGQYGGANDQQLKSLTEAKSALVGGSLTDEQGAKLTESLGLPTAPGKTKKDYEEQFNVAIKARQKALKDLIIAQQSGTTGVQQTPAREALGDITTIKRGREQLKITL